MKNLFEWLNSKWSCWHGLHLWEYHGIQSPTVYEALTSKSVTFCNFEHWQCKYCGKITRKHPKR